MSILNATWKGRLKSRSKIAKDIIEFRLDKPEGFTYHAGQFVRFIAPSADGTVLRSYSIASHPSEDDLLFFVKILQDGIFSSYVTSAPIGSELEWHGPLGRFVHEYPPSPVLFIATGAGFAPIHGLIRDQLIRKKNTEQIALLFGVRSKEDIFCQAELNELRNRFSNFSFQITLSKPDGSWTGQRGRVTEHLPAEYGNQRVFACGSAGMIKDARAHALKQGLADEKFHFEVF